MKLLIFTDLHNSKSALQRIKATIRVKMPDILICCGDISIFELNLNGMLKSLSDLRLPLLLVHGNHETKEHVAKLCKKYRNIHFIHESPLLINKTLFLGYGGDGFSLIDPHFEKITTQFQKSIKKSKAERTILITHAPPHKTNLDRILGGHCGNKSIRKFIEKTQPSYAFCGHIHENFGRVDKIKKTVVMNPGPFGKMVTLSD